MAPSSALDSALLPFRFCERYKLPRSYERSFRFQSGHLFANRFILGVPAQRLTIAMFNDLLSTFDFPDRSLTPVLQWQAQRASTIYLGFSEAGKSHSRRLYFEFWEEVAHRVQANAFSHEATPQVYTQGVGYKWCPQRPASFQRTDYVHPVGLRTADLLECCRGYLSSVQSARDAAKHQPATALDLLPWLAHLLSRHPEIQPVFLQARDHDSQRDSFDLGLHPYGIGLGELIASWRHLIDGLLCPSEQQRLRRLAPANCLVTHLSAGRASCGQPYLCLYYQSDD